MNKNESMKALPSPPCTQTKLEEIHFSIFP